MCFVSLCCKTQGKPQNVGTVQKEVLIKSKCFRCVPLYTSSNIKNIKMLCMYRHIQSQKSLRALKGDAYSKCSSINTAASYTTWFQIFKPCIVVLLWHTRNIMCCSKIENINYDWYSLFCTILYSVSFWKHRTGKEHRPGACIWVGLLYTSWSWRNRKNHQDVYLLFSFSFSVNLENC